MGLDITAYSHMKAIGKHEKDRALNEGEPGGLDDWCYYDDHVLAFAYNAFPDSFLGIPILGTKQTSGSTFLVGGCYATTADTETVRFGAGSYSGYGWWRDDLRRQFNPDTDPDGPFYELIWFADNEGCIGEIAAANLLADFRAHAAAYSPEQHGAYAAEKYANWTHAFELAAAGGLVHFH